MDYKDVVISEIYQVDTGFILVGAAWDASFPKELKKKYPNPKSSHGQKIIVLDEIRSSRRMFKVAFCHDQKNSFSMSCSLFKPLESQEKECKCNILLYDCNCGVFEKEMKEKGNIYNKFLKTWVKVLKK